MFKSLRWRLQVWHAFVLMAVISSFGGIVHRLHWQTRLQQVDAELERTSGVVLSQMRRLIPRPPRPPGRPDDSRPERETGPRTDQTRFGRPDSPRGEPDFDRFDRRPAPPRERSPRDLRPLPAEFDQLFHGEEDSRLYFVIWGGRGEILQKSESAPVIEFPNLKIEANGLPKRETRERHADRVYREVVHAGMFNVNVLVGRSLEKDLVAHRQSGVMLAATGFVILAAGVLGGGWLSARAIRPITEMTTAAESISGSNLSERINIHETDTELGKLAVVLNRTFDRLQAAFERQSQFTADASHELRTPLSVISTHTELALSRPRSNEDYRLAIETCQRASQRMKSLIDALLLLARFESGAPSLKHDPLDLEQLVRDCGELVQPLADERNIQIRFETTPCPIVGDGNRLSQVVTNLLTNSIRYNSDNGSVRISTRIEDSVAVIAVSDSGIGISEDELPRIFDRFYQVDKARSRAEGSCGLGLSICKTIVEAHGGTIAVTSQLNVGTTFEIRLTSSIDLPALMSVTLNER